MVYLIIPLQKIKMNHQNNLINELITKRQADEFLWNLDEIKESLYKNKQSTVILIKKRFSFATATFLINYFQDEKNNMSNKDIISDKINKIRVKIDSIPIFDLTFAITPSAEYLEKISNLIENQLNRHIFINVKIDPSIVAGAIIQYDGKHGDYSLANKLI